MNRLLLILMVAMSWLATFAQEIVEVDDQVDVRENPVMDDLDESQFSLSHVADFSQYNFINLKSNHIDLNGADWSALSQRFACAADTVISIVHIGDSHTQAEGATTRTRSLMQRHFGSAGRGLIIPFKLAGTNQPLDYSITSTSDFEVSKMMKHPWTHEMGFTGISLSPKRKNFDFTITTKAVDGVEQDFDVVRMYFHGTAPKIVSADEDGRRYALFSEQLTDDTLSIYLMEPAVTLELRFQKQGDIQIFGFELQNSMCGVEYSAIGNNGAMYMSYNEVGTVGRDLQAFSPNLVIISLGTNEAFGKVSDDAMYTSIDKLVGDIRRHNPQTQLLLVTPAECQKATYTRRKGRKRRVKSYVVNDNVKRLRNVMLRYGREQSVPTYDWYAVAGGDGSSTHWLAKELMKSDRIHDTWAGYSLQGALLYEALIETINRDTSR